MKNRKAPGRDEVTNLTLKNAPKKKNDRQTPKHHKRITTAKLFSHQMETCYNHHHPKTRKRPETTRKPQTDQPAFPTWQNLRKNHSHSTY